MTLIQRRSVPRVPAALVVPARARAKLDRRAPVTIVRGAQGYGKTTAVASWLRDQPTAVRPVWVTAQPFDQPDRFAERLLGELGVSGLLSHDRVAVPRAGRLDAAALLMQIPQRAYGERVVIVIDDAHWLHDEVLLGDLVDVVARHDQLHLIVCGRGRHPLEHLVARGSELVIVPAHDLLLDLSEIAALADAMAVPLTAERAEWLHSALGGWVAPVRLVLEETDPTGQGQPLARAGAYLNDTVLPGIGDQEVLQQVMRFALAERLTHRLIRDLAGEHDPDVLIRMVEASGLAQRRYEQEDVLLVFPSFVRAGVCDWFARSQPSAAREMHRALAHWYAARDEPGHPMFAFRHAAAAENWNHVNRVWSLHSMQMILEHPIELGEVFDALPEAVLKSHPSMQVAHEMSRAAEVADSDGNGWLVVMRTYVEACQRAVAAGVDTMPLHDLLAVGTGHLIYLRMRGLYSEAEQFADHVEELATARIVGGADPGDRMPWFHVQRGLTRALVGDSAGAVHRYQLGWQQRRATTPHVAALAASCLTLSQAMAGDHRAADHWSRQHSEVEIGSTWGSRLNDAGAHLGRALLALDRLDPDACLIELEQVGGGDAPMEIWPFVAFVTAQYGLHYDDPAATMARLDALHRARPPAVARGRGAQLLLARARADLLIAEGQGQHALAVLADHDSENTPILAVPLVRLLLLSGEPAAAGNIAAPLLWARTTDNRARQELLVLSAVAWHRSGDASTSADMARRALRLLEHTSLLRPFATMDRADLETLFDGSGRGLSPPYSARLRLVDSPFPQSVVLLQLTSRERLLAHALGTTASRQQMADNLYVSVNTVRAQLATLYRKLGVHTRTEALAELAKLGFTSTDSPAPVLPVRS